MTVAYPNYRIDDIEYTAKIWADFLGGYSYEQANMALRTYITADTSGFAPSIGQLINKLHEVQSPQELNEMEAWSLLAGRYEMAIMVQLKNLTSYHHSYKRLSGVLITCGTGR